MAERRGRQHGSEREIRERARQLIYSVEVGRYFVRLLYVESLEVEERDSFSVQWRLPAESKHGVDAGEKFGINGDDVCCFMNSKRGQLEKLGPCTVQQGPGLGHPSTRPITERIQYAIRRPK